MTSAQQVFELSRLFLADKDGSIVVLKAFIDESGVHAGSPVLTVAAYTGKPKAWRDWTKAWNIKKRPIKVYHAADAANLEGEFEGWKKEDMNALAERLLPVIAGSELAGVLVGIHMTEFENAIRDYPHLREILGSPYGACFHWLVGTIIRIQNNLGTAERISFVHENNDYQGEALQSFDWIKKNVNHDDRLIALAFGSKADYTPLQAADILAYEGNKRLREPQNPARRAWTALKPKNKILVGYFGKQNMKSLIDSLSGLHHGLLAVGRRDGSGPYWAG